LHRQTSRIESLAGNEENGMSLGRNEPGRPSPVNLTVQAESLSIGATVVNQTLATSPLMPSDPPLQSIRNSAEPLETDRQGHFVGPASGVSFLLRIQKKLASQKSAFPSDSSIFTFGDRPLPESNPAFCILPPKSEAQVLLSRYFDFAIATHRFLHRQTAEGWLEQIYDPTRESKGVEERSSFLAVLFMIFAQASLHRQPVAEERFLRDDRCA
jgi:hypothetical protein